MSSYHFSQLPEDIIIGVFAFLFRDIFHEHSVIDDYWEAMEIATVCRLWSACIPSFVYRFVFIQRKIQTIYSEQHRSNVEQVTWTSNVRSLLWQKRSLEATGLRVVMDDDYTGPLQLINAITAFGLASAPWSGFKRIQFFGKGILRAGTAAGLPDTLMDAMDFCDFFARNYVSLEELRLHPTLPSLNDGVEYALDALTSPEVFDYTTTPYYSMLLSMHVQRLKYLECCQPAFLLLSSLTLEHLTALDLDLDCLRLNGQVAKFNFPALETVKLINIRGRIPFDFTRVHIAGKFRYSYLKSIYFEFRKATGSQQHSLISIVRPLCSYPNLSKLMVSRSTGVYQDLYSTFTGTPLRLLQINEDHRALARIDTNIIQNIDSLHLETISHDTNGWLNGPARLITRFYLAESAMRKAVLDVYLPFPTQLSWTNLVCLYLGTDVATASNIVRLMGQLPLLKFLHVMCISMDVHDTFNYFWETDDRRADIRAATAPTILGTISLDNLDGAQVYEAVNTSLQVFGIYTPGHFDEESLSKLPLVLPSLRKFAIDLEYGDTLRANLMRIAPGVEVCDLEDISYYFKVD